MATRFALIGSGYMGETYAECLEKFTSDARLAVVAGGSRAPTLAAKHSVDLEASLEAAIRRTDVDAVIVATPHSTHLPLARIAADAGKHLFLEKPMALNVSECDQILAASRKAGILVGVNAVTRYRDSPLTAKRLIDDGSIGEVRMIRVLSSTTGYDAPDKPWILDPGEGSVWLDWGTHGCDALRWLTGSEAQLAFARLKNFSQHPVPGLSAMAEYSFASGVIAQVWMSFEMPPPGLGSSAQYLIVGSKGMIDCDAYGKVRLGTGAGWREVFEQPAFDFIHGPLDPRRLKAFAAQVQEFASCIQRGGPPGVTGEDGRAAIEMVEAAERSDAAGQAISLPLQSAASEAALTR